MGMQLVEVPLSLSTPPEGRLLGYIHAKQHGPVPTESPTDYQARLCSFLAPALDEYNNPTTVDAALKKLHILSLLSQWSEASIVQEYRALFFKDAKHAYTVCQTPFTALEDKLCVAGYWLLALDLYDASQDPLDQQMEILLQRLEVADAIMKMLENPQLGQHQWARELAEKYATPTTTVLPFALDPVITPPPPASSSASSSVPAPPQTTKRARSPSLPDDAGKKKKARKEKKKKAPEAKPSAPRKKPSERKGKLTDRLAKYSFPFDTQRLAEILPPERVAACKTQEEFDKLIEEYLCLGVVQRMIQSSLPLPAESLSLISAPHSAHFKPAAVQPLSNPPQPVSVPAAKPTFLPFLRKT